jgi:hypothetical protein
VPDASDVVRAVVRTTSVVQLANGKRVLYIDVHSNQVVTALVTITRDGRTLSHKLVTGMRGNRRIRIEIPASARPGPARLRVKFRNASGHSRLVTRAVQIPRVRMPSLLR